MHVVLAFLLGLLALTMPLVAVMVVNTFPQLVVVISISVFFAFAAFNIMGDAR